MIKSFRKYNENVPCFEVVTINLSTGEFTQFSYVIHTHNNKQYLVKFGVFTTNSNNMGYNNPKDYLKRAKELRYQEFDTTELDHIPAWNPLLAA